MSVLVDDRFAGTLDDLRAARVATSLPLLAKGFFTTRDELVAVREAGADAALLILRDLTDTATTALLEDARALGLDALVEAHDARELERATALGARIVGINARDLATFRIDRQAQLRLLADAPRDRILIAESAIDSRAQAAEAELAGANAVLIGSTLMRAPTRREAGRARLATARQGVRLDAPGGCRCRRGGRRRPRRVHPRRREPAAGGVTARRTRDRSARRRFRRRAVRDRCRPVQFYEREDGHRARDAMLLRGGEPSAPSSICRGRNATRRIWSGPAQLAAA